jgi:hypothetical protein
MQREYRSTVIYRHTVHKHTERASRFHVATARRLLAIVQYNSVSIYKKKRLSNVQVAKWDMTLRGHFGDCSMRLLWEKKKEEL